MERLKLLVEEPVFEYDVLLEDKTEKGSTMYIQGAYLMGEKPNKNGRIYQLNEMVDEVKRYTDEMIRENRSIGELNHPQSVEVNPERACHMITEMKQSGNVFTGKSKILSNPMGQIVRALISDGVKLGVSSRALGKVVDGKDGVKLVEKFHLVCCDVVSDPSVNMGKGGTQAFVNGVLEARSWILDDNGFLVEAYDKFDADLAVLPRRGIEKDAKLKNAVINFINSIKNCE